MKIRKGYQYRICPDEDQRALFNINIGHSRFVYNRLLDKQEELYKAGKKHMSKTAMNNYVNRTLKKEYEWLKDADKFSLTNAAYALDNAYKAFFEKRADHPKHKSKRKSKLSYKTNITNNNIEIGEDFIKLPKAGEVKAIIHRRAPEGGKIKNATVTMNRDGTYLASVLIEYEMPDIVIQKKEPDILAMDYKSDGLYVDQHGNACGMPHYFRKSEEKLRKEQRKLSRMLECHTTGYGKTDKGYPYPIYDRPLEECKNIQKQKVKVAKIHAHVANQRKDFLHKKSTEIANQYDVVVAEGMDMRSISNKGFGNGKATLDNGFGMFRTMLDYKLKERGKTLILADRWYPSSQLCSCCGFKNKKIKDLRIRSWTCPECGAVHDRDRNAAINLYNEGKRILNIPA